MLVRIDDKAEWNVLAESVNWKPLLAFEALLKTELSLIDQRLRRESGEEGLRLQGRAQEVEEILALFDVLRKTGPKQK
jgi:hypothetical protein